MNKSILKLVVVGIAFGAAAFFMPFFLIKAFLVILIVGALFRLMGRRRGPGGRHMAFADSIRNMSNEEYEAFKGRSQGGCYHNSNKREDKK